MDNQWRSMKLRLVLRTGLETMIDHSLKFSMCIVYNYSFS